jgi:signal transduction histidine kinase
LQDLLDNILQWARIQKKNIEPNIESTDINKIINNVVELYAPAAAFKKIGIEVRSEDNAIVDTDRLMMNFIIRNIVNNAVKFCANSKQILIEMKRSGGSFTISIKDEGKGFSKNILEKLNNKEVNEDIQAEGSGIGLSVSRQFIKLLNGNMEFRNSENGGGEVVISINQA